MNEQEIRKAFLQFAHNENLANVPLEDLLFAYFKSGYEAGQPKWLPIALNRLDCIRAGLERAKTRLDATKIGVAEYNLIDGMIQTLLPLTVLPIPPEEKNDE